MDAGQFRRRQDPVGQDDEAGPHDIAAVGVDRPPFGLLVPLGLLHGGVEQTVFIEAKLLRHALAILEDLEP